MNSSLKYNKPKLFSNITAQLKVNKSRNKATGLQDLVHFVSFPQITSNILLVSIFGGFSCVSVVKGYTMVSSNFVVVMKNDDFSKLYSCARLTSVLLQIRAIFSGMPNRSPYQSSSLRLTARKQITKLNDQIVKIIGALETPTNAEDIWIIL